MEKERKQIKKRGAHGKNSKKGEKNNHHQTGRGGVGQLDHRALGLATFGSGKTHKKPFTKESRKEFSTIVKLVAPNDS